MNSVFNPKARLLITLFGSLLSVGCVSATIYQPALSEQPSMSRFEALKAINDSVSNIDRHEDQICRAGNDSISTVKFSSQRMVVHCKNGSTSSFDYVATRNPTVSTDSLSCCYLVYLMSHEGWKKSLRWKKTSGGQAIAFAKAWYALAVPPSGNNSSSEFKIEASQYRQAGIPSELPESVRRFQVQAENAVKEKRFLDAAESYNKALRITPWWSQGHFNLALICGELEFYPEAMAEMHKYLLLIPDAPNARAAQDKIYEWEGKVGK